MSFFEGLRWLGEKAKEGMQYGNESLEIANRSEDNHGIAMTPQEFVEPVVVFSADPTVQHQFEATQAYLAPTPLPVMDVSGASYGKQNFLNPRENLQSRRIAQAARGLGYYREDPSYSVGPQELLVEPLGVAGQNVAKAVKEKTGEDLSWHQIIRLLQGKGVTLDMTPYLQGVGDNDFPAQVEVNGYLNTPVVLAAPERLPEVELTEDEVFLGVMSEEMREQERERRRRAKNESAWSAFGNGLMNRGGEIMEGVGDFELWLSQLDRNAAEQTRAYQEKGFSPELIDPYGVYLGWDPSEEEGLVGREAQQATQKEEVAPRLQGAWGRKQEGKKIQERYGRDLRYVDGEMLQKLAYDLGGFSPEIVAEPLAASGRAVVWVFNKLGYFRKMKAGVQGSKTLNAIQKKTLGANLDAKIEQTTAELKHLVSGNQYQPAPAGVLDTGKSGMYRTGRNADDGRVLFASGDEGRNIRKDFPREEGATGRFVEPKEKPPGGRPTAELENPTYIKHHGTMKELKQYRNEWVEPKDLEQLTVQGEKFTQEKVLMTFRNKEDRVFWLEEGNYDILEKRYRAGLFHILEEHEKEFLTKEISPQMIPEIFREVINGGKHVGYTKSNPTHPRRVFETSFQGNSMYLALELGDNGFIVSGHPISLQRIRLLKEEL